MGPSAPPVCLVWLRRDLRIADHAPLAEAVRRGFAPIPVYLHAPGEEGAWAPGGASQWWLHHALEDLAGQLEIKGLGLVLRRASHSSLRELQALATETGAKAVFWHRRYEPGAMKRDAAIKEALRAQGIEARSFSGSGLGEPSLVRNLSGKPYQVFTAFWKAVRSQPLPPPATVDWASLAPPLSWPDSDALDAWGLLPVLPWDREMREHWHPTRAGAEGRLRSFLQKGATRYGDERDRPDHDGTTLLSPWLHFGQISPREVWRTLCDEADGHSPAIRDGIVRQLWWREFALHLLIHFPETPDRPLRPEYEAFPWRHDPALLAAWQKGRTGYPIVDAGMRQLWALGWMHNRVRMIAASLLVKHLLQPWQDGASWFWDTLVDADLANNTLGWQWTAGCGADAAPYFRVFNPVSQGRKFDPQGDYVRRWVPEIAALPNEWIHEPWNAPDAVWRTAGLRRTHAYPDPIVGLNEGRDRALAAWKKLKAETKS